MANVHAFNVEHAQEYGLEAAIVIHQLASWIRYNHANGKNFRNGRTWAFNSYASWAKLFPYFHPSKIRRALDTLVEKGILLKIEGKKEEGYPPNWYAFQDEETFVGTLPPVAKSSEKALSSAAKPLSPAAKPLNKESSTEQREENTPLPPKRPGFDAKPGGVGQEFRSSASSNQRGPESEVTEFMPDGTRRLTNDQLNRLEQLSMRATGQPGYNPADMIFYRKWLHDGGSLEWLEEIVEATIQSKGEGGLGSMAYFKRQMTRYLAEKSSSEVVTDSAAKPDPNELIDTPWGRKTRRLWEREQPVYQRWLKEQERLARQMGAH